MSSLVVVNHKSPLFLMVLSQQLITSSNLQEPDGYAVALCYACAVKEDHYCPQHRDDLEYTNGCQN